MSSAQPPRQSQAQPAQKPKQARGKRGRKNDSNSQPGSSYVPVSSSSSSSSSSASPVQVPAYGAEPEIDLVGVDGRIFRKQKVNSFKRTGGSSVNAYRRPVGVSETPTKIPMLDDEPDCKASAFAEKIASSFAQLDVQEEATKQAPAEKRSAVERTLKKIEIEGKDPDWKWTVSLLPDISKKIQSPSLSESFRLMTNQNSSCVFSFPPSKSPAISTFQINGPSLSAVEKARISAIRLIETVVDSIGFTHYLSVEFDEIDGPFKDFAGLVPNSEVVGKYVSKLEHLHVTLFLMKLFTPDQVKEATALFRSLSPNLYDLADTMSVWVNIHNLCTFSEDITKTRVLYFDIAEANASSPLKRIREFLCDEFERADYPGNFRESYTPHLTALNCKFSDGKPFDATEILSQFAGFSLGKFRVKQIKLLARNPTKLLAQTNLP